MHETHPLEEKLRREAERISARYKGAPVIIIIAGTGKLSDPEDIPKRCMIASTLRPEKHRLRDIVGILQTAIQIETLKHFFPDAFKKKISVDKLVTC
ncbi:MAG: hypothetical protein ACE5L7_07915 [Candidatus Aminicenantales bacterium]